MSGRIPGVGPNLPEGVLGWAPRHGDAGVIDPQVLQSLCPTRPGKNSAPFCRHFEESDQRPVTDHGFVCSRSSSRSSSYTGSGSSRSRSRSSSFSSYSSHSSQHSSFSGSRSRWVSVSQRPLFEEQSNVC